MTLEPDSNWQAALPVSQVDDLGLHAVTLGDHKLLLLRADGELHAYRDACPHEVFPLSLDGVRQDLVIMCRKHRWEFEAATGEHISRIRRPQCNLQRYPVRQVDGMIEVDVGTAPPPTLIPVSSIKPV